MNGSGVTVASAFPPRSALDDELSVPKNATLLLPPSVKPASLVFLPAAPPSSSSGDRGCGSGSSGNVEGPSVAIAFETSLRARSQRRRPRPRNENNGDDGGVVDDGPPPRSLVIGRQASTADVRVDHKSVSRRHAALYYLPRTGDGDGDGSDGTHFDLVLRDNGGKHGTHVNGSKLEPKGAAVLRDGDVLRVGNVSDTIFRVRMPGGGSDYVGPSAGHKTCPLGAEGTTAADASSGGGDASGKRTTTAPNLEGLTGRERREAEIRAMMESLDEAPTFKRYRAPDGEDAPEGEVEGRVERQRPTSSSSSLVPRRRPTTEANNASSHGLPVTSVVELVPADAPTSSSTAGAAAHRKMSGVVAIAFDPAGSRLAVGHTDATLRLYDFGGMDASHRGFKTIEVDEGQPVVDVSYSGTGDRMVVGTTSAQPKVLDRDGHELHHFIKGDVYVTDQSKTTGHTSAVTGSSWHPLERDVVLTSSLDGSARLWNLKTGKTQFQKLVCSRVYRAKSAKGKRTGVTAIAYHPAGREFALGTTCGSIQIWDATRLGTRPERDHYDAHGSGRAVNCLSYSHDGTKLATRSLDDDRVHIWDAKRLTRSSYPIATCNGLPNLFEASNCAFGPDGKTLCAGTSVEPVARRDGHASRGSPACGTLKFYAISSAGGSGFGSEDDADSPSILELDVSPGASAVRVAWHPRLNQIVVGSSDGAVRVLFDADLSEKGALMSTARVARTKDDLSLLLATRAPTGSAGVTGEILTPHALPMFRNDQRETKRKRDKERLDPEKSRRPEPPATGVKMGGQSSAQQNFTQFVVKATIQNKNIAGKDPREELFKYSEGKSYVSKAYEGDKEVVLADKTAEQEEEEMKEQKKT